ncbi:oxidoreductase [Nakamurella leprariae]|uniref:FAD-dependent oxidoreductase n=1 Tax=Nakamurella leprariae TaxID=2803911 RepID=A0A938Y5M0_9ACTN|nr:FAD-dependent oxidoreductase [Nakamurella leprariae]MBM9466471.1 FAD-dependent oxidoreductase [Nakamurella leprariae]
MATTARGADPASGAARYPHALAPVTIGGVPLRNRIFVSAHTTNFGRDFLPTDRHVAYHRERARGGAGLIMTEPLRVHETSLGRAGGLSGDERGLPMLERIVTAVRDEGAAVFSQLTHAGRHSENPFLRTASWGPSPRRFTAGGQTPHAMTRADMTAVRDAYVAAARVAVRAGFQGLEIHFGHGHLLHQFISPASNARTDAYGGDEDGRLRYPLEVLDAVLDAVGAAVPVGVRMSADELLPGGQDLASGCRIAAAVTSTRPIAFLNVSVSSYTVPSVGHHVADMSEGPAPYLPQEQAVAAAVAGAVPVLAACRFTDIATADKVLAEGTFAALAMTRAHIADPHLVRKVQAGAENTVRPCVSCNFCIGEIAGHRPITCMMNPRVGREQEWPEAVEAVAEPRSVLVVGGGPAGLEAAAISAERGHRVELWEAADELGGQLRTGRRGSGRGDLDLLRESAERRLAAANAVVDTDRAADVSSVREHGADVVVIAAGAARPARAVPGARRTLSVAQALGEPEWRGLTALVLDDEGSWAGASVAETMARAGATVTVVTATPTAFPGVSEYSRMTAVQRLRELGVDLWTSSRVDLDDTAAVVTRSLVSGTVRLPVPDVVVVVDVPDAADRLAVELQDAGVPVHLIGDALAPRSLLEAVYEGHRVGRAL